MRLIEEKHYLTIQPNLNISRFNSLNVEQKKSYLYLVSAYYHFLILYLLKNTNLKSFDNNVANSNLKFEQISTENKDYYQYYGSEDLNYYYVRNNINLSNLTIEEQGQFIDIIKKSNNSLTAEIENFIQRTIVKVIGEPNLHASINYGPPAERFFAENGSLVIGVRYNEFNGEANEAAWEENYDKQEIFLLQNNTLLEKNIEEKLNIKCKVIKYNELSIKKLSINSQKNK